MNNIPLDNGLRKLLNNGIIIKSGNLLTLNPYETENAKRIKEVILSEYKYNFNSLPLRIFYAIIEMSNKLSEINEIKRVILFGSYAKLIYSEKSDIDIAVVFGNKAKNKKIAEKMTIKIAEKIREKSGKKIELHFFLEKDLKEKDPLIKDILKNGRIIF